MVLFGLSLTLATSPAAPTTNDFSGAGGLTPYSVASWPAPAGTVVDTGTLRLPATSDTNTIVVFDLTATNTYRRIVAEWTWTCPNAREGFSFNLLNTAIYGSNGVSSFSGAPPCLFDEPVFTNGLSIAFDTYNTSDYQGLGQHEVSLHWDGLERVNKRCPIDFRTGVAMPVQVVIDYVMGGANVSVTINGTSVYTNYFLAAIAPYESRVAFAVRATSTANVWRVDNVNVAFTDPGTTPAPQIVRTFDSELMKSSNRKPKKTFALPPDGRSYARIVLAMTLSEPVGGFDPWDRKMDISVFADNGERFEIARFMTPYAKAWTWYVDVTDFQTLLRGTRQMQAYIDTWVTSGGWLVTADLLYYEGVPDAEAFKIQNLWVGEPRYGDTNNPISNFFTPRTVTIDPTATKLKTRLMVTGHGQSPNSQNAAEFIVRGRTLTVGASSYYNVLWKNDCYLNPCRPQGGTWQYSRAGWAPGDRVDHWEQDITSVVTPGGSATIQYTADLYTNLTIDSSNPARHWVDSQLVSYRVPLQLSGIAVQQPVGNTIPSGGSKDLGAVSILGATNTVVFTITNNSASTLNLTGSPRVSVSGANASDFTVTAQPATPIAGGGGTTFTVQFVPGGGGARSALLTMVSDDANYTNYVVNLSGTGELGLLWSGSGANWDTATAANWLLLPNATSNYVFANGVATALFDDRGNANTNVNLVGSLSPVAVTFNATNSNYTLAGSGSLSGSMALTKSNATTLTILNNNLYAGATTISGGTLQLGNGTAGNDGNLADGSDVVNNASLVFNRFGSSSYGGDISGTGTVTKNGTGTQTLSGANTYSGGTTVNAGTLHLTGALSGGGNITVNNGAVFTEGAEGSVTAVNYTQNSTSTCRWDGTTTLSAQINVFTNGTLVINGPGSSAGGTISWGGTVIIGTGGADFTFNPNGNNFNIGGNVATPQAGNAFQTNGTIFMGGAALNIAVGGTGTFNLLGGTITNSGANLNLGIRICPNFLGNGGANGTFNQIGGTINFPAGGIMIGRADGGVTFPAGQISRATFSQTGGSTSVGLFAMGGSLNKTPGVFATNTITGGTFITTNFVRMAEGTNDVVLMKLGGSAQVTLPAIPTTRGAGSTADITFDFTTGFLSPLAASPSYMPMNCFANAYLTANGARFNVASGKDIIIAQVLKNATGMAGTLTKSGTGVLTCFGANTYSGNTTVNGGTLSVTTAYFSTNSTISVANGAVLNLTFAQTNRVAGFITNGVSLAAGVYKAANMSPFITGSGSLQVASSGPTGPASLTNNVSGNTLNLSWPAGQGWRLQMQTNSLSTGLSTNWIYVTDGSVSITNISVNQIIPAAFFRLTYP